MEAKWLWLAITAVAPVAWGSNYFVTRQFLPDDSPLWGAVLRALPAGLILLALARRRPHGSWWWRPLVLGVLNVGAFFVLVYQASQLLPTSIASTLMATSAAVLMLLAWPLLRERPRMLGIAGAAVGFAGVCLMLLEPTGEPVDPLGVAVSLGAMLMSSVGFLLATRWGGEVPVLPLTSWQLIGGGLVVVPFALVVEGPPPALDAPAVLAFCYVTVMATALAFFCWFAGLRHLPAGSVGLVGLLNPVTGVLLGTLVAGEAFGPAQAGGTALVLGGVLLGQLRGRSAARRRAGLNRAAPGDAPTPRAPAAPAPTGRPRRAS